MLENCESVSKMFDIIVNSKGKFSIIDAGCGNGWAVRHIGKHPNCKSSTGLDGSDLMIKKAKKLDSNNQYFLAVAFRGANAKHNTKRFHNL